MRLGRGERNEKKREGSKDWKGQNENEGFKGTGKAEIGERNSDNGLNK